MIFQVLNEWPLSSEHSSSGYVRNIQHWFSNSVPLCHGSPDARLPLV